MENQAPNQPVWFQGIGDSLLRKLHLWFKIYETGEVSRTRPAFVEGEYKPIPTQYSHDIAWHPREIDSLVNILNRFLPNSSLLEDIRRLQAGLKKSRQLPGNFYIVTLPFFKEDIKEMIRCVELAKKGTDGIKSHIENNNSNGGIWDMGNATKS